MGPCSLQFDRIGGTARVSDIADDRQLGVLRQPFGQDAAQDGQLLVKRVGEPRLRSA